MAYLLSGQETFDGHAFSNALPIPQVIDTASRKFLTLQMRQTDQFLGLYDGDGNALSTTVWGYGWGANVTYPGPTILAYEGEPIRVRWDNQLPVEGHLLPVDTSIHLADPVRRPLEDGFVPTVTHLHGGHTESASDGDPDAWFTQNRGTNAGRGGLGPGEVGPAYEKAIYEYDNDQQGASLWYHDHAVGITRLNVYAGLAGFYILQDDQRLGLEADGVLPSGAFDIGLAVQDRAFTSDGQLYMPAYKDDTIPGTEDTVGDMVPQDFYDEFGEDAASALPEFFGDHILVNGMAWPSLEVAAGEYQFRLLNGSDSRVYVLKVDDPSVEVTLVGADGGLLPEAVVVADGDGEHEADEFLIMAPGDRLDVVLDFSGASGDTVRLLNIGPAFEPFKGLEDAFGTLAGGAEAAAADDGVGNVMEFRVNDTLEAFHTQGLADGTILNAGFTALAADVDSDGVADAAGSVRRLGLFEGVDAYGRINPLLGTAEEGALHTDRYTPDGAFGPLSYTAQTTETPELDSIEQWEMFNFTADSHPIHLHLVQYQVVEKRKIHFVDEDEDGIPDDVDGDDMITYGRIGQDGSPDLDDPDGWDYDIWIGESVSLRPEETGLQDTVLVDPGEMMSIVAEFDRPGDYVWHCHILSHEDHEMMRPFTVVEPGAVA